MRAQWSSLLVILAVATHLVDASHFRGGTIQWRPVNANPGSFDGRIEITHRVAWRRSAGSSFYCDSTTITSNRLLSGEGSLQCRSGCGGTIGSMSYYCTSYSVTEDWSAGERTYTYNTGGVSSFEASFSSCCWISLRTGGGSWSVRVRVNLATRPDTGLINTSPASSISPIVRVQLNCDITIQIPVQDVDGDDVRCRWAVGNECGGVCQTFPAVLNMCSIRYTGNSLSPGWYGVALQIEDFASPSSTTPLSSVPLQFLVNVYYTGSTCASRPELVGSTVADGVCIGVPFGTTWSNRIIAQSGSSTVSIREIITTSPPGFQKSSLFASSTPRQWYVDVSWTPTPSQAGPHFLCISAVDNIGQTSPQRCVTLLAGGSGPQIVNLSPTTRISETQTLWTITYDRALVRPSQTKYIRLYEAAGGTEILRIDASVSTDVSYPTNSSVHQLSFNTNYPFVSRQIYYILLDQGVAVGTDYCGLVSSEVQDSNFWRVQVGCNHGEIRLVGGSMMSEGRVEVCFNDSWGTVCDDYWSTVDANVLCKQIGYSGSDAIAYDRAFFGQGSTQMGIFMDNVACGGTESRLIDCPFDRHTADCIHAEDAGVRCQEVCTNGGIRLLGGQVPSEGRVEICVNKAWGTICDDVWTTSDANVACKQAGFSGSDAVAYGGAHFGQAASTLSIHIDKLLCSGFEPRLINCPHDNHTLHCTHANDASVVCQQPCVVGDVRLSGGQSSDEGRVEVCVGGDWGTVCDNFWSTEDANVVCSQLGFSNLGAASFGGAYFGQGLNLRIHINNALCAGSERRLIDCSHSTSTSVCTHSEDAGIRCLQSCEHGAVQLANGAYSFEGRLEVCLNGLWGTICDVNWSEVESSVLCNQLGYLPFRPTAYQNYGQGTVPVLIEDSLRCTGTEPGILLCPPSSNSTEGETCQIVTVRCHDIPLTLYYGTTINKELSNGEYDFYRVTFGSGGITVSLAVRQGEVSLYAGDQAQSVSDIEGNYDWTLTTNWYKDIFIDPASVNRSIGNTVYITLKGNASYSNVTIDTSYGDTSTIELDIEDQIIEQLDYGSYLFYSLPFLRDGVTLEVNVITGSVLISASVDEHNPTSENGNWMFNISGYEKIFLHRNDLQQFYDGPVVFVAVYGLNESVSTFDITILTTTEPSEPQNPFVRTLNGYPTELELLWTPPEDINGNLIAYSVYYFAYPNGPPTKISVLPPQTSLRITGLLPYTRYGFYVTATNYVGEGGTSITSTGVTDETVPATVPSNFASIVINATAIFLTWSPPQVPNGIIISYQVNYSMSGQLVTLLLGNISDYVVSDLEEYTWYTFTISSFTRIGQGPSTSVSARTDIAEPSGPPLNVQSTVTGTKTAEITWAPPVFQLQNGPVLYYVIRLEDQWYNTDVILINTTTTSLFATVNNLEEYAQYSCQVAAATSAGVGLYSDEIFFTTFEDIPTAPPDLVNTTSINPYVISLQWEPPPPVHQNGIIQYYIVHVSETNTGRFWTFYSVDPSLLVSALHPYYLYEFDVAAITIGTGPFASVTVQTEEAPPSAAPSALVLQSYTSQSITLSWESPPEEDINGILRQFVVRILEHETGNIFTETSDDEQTTLLGLHPYYTYSVAVAAQTVGAGPFSNNITIQLAEDVPSSAPENVQGYAVDSTSIFISWSPPLPMFQNGMIRRYLICITEIETGNAFNYSTSLTSYMLHSLHPYYSYEIEVAAETIAPGPFSTPLIIQTQTDVPASEPLLLMISSITSKSFYLSWSPPPVEDHNGAIIGYVIQVTQANTGESFNITSQQNRAEIGSLKPFTTYICVVAAQTSAGIGPYSTIVIVQTDEDAPSSAPESLRAVTITSTSISLMWAAPPEETRNGVIRNYRVNITEEETGRVFTFISLTNSLVVPSLHPYYTYQCRVSAFTVDYGPFTDVLTITTMEDVPSGYPENIGVSGVTSSSAVINWTPPPLDQQNGLIIGYIVNMTDIQSGVTFQLVSFTTQITADNLSPFTIYSVVIEAFTAVGSGPCSTPYTFTTGEDVPSLAPVNTFSQVIDSRSLLLSWEDLPPEHHNGILQGYNVSVVEQETGREFYYSSAISMLIVTSLHPAYTYEWRLAAFTRIGEGPYSFPPNRIQTSEDVPSGAPQSFTGTPNITSIQFSWTPPIAEERNGNITGYTIFITSLVNPSDYHELMASSESLLATSLQPYTTYECAIAASTQVGMGPNSNVIYVMTEPTNPSGTASNVSGIALNSTHVHLTWDHPPRELWNGELSQYRIDVVEVETGTTLRFFSDPSITEATIGSLHPYYTYNCTISAVTVGEGPPSTVITVRTAEDAPTGSPLSLSATSLGATSIQISWQQPLPSLLNGILRDYSIEVKSNRTGEVFSYFTSAHSITVPSLRPYTVYLCRVAAVTVETGPYTQSFAVLTDIAAPDAPPSLSGEALTSTSISLLWAPPPEYNQNGVIEYYRIEITDEDNIMTQHSTNGTTMTLTVTGLHPYYTYSSRIAAATGAGMGPFSSATLLETLEDAPSSPPMDLVVRQVMSTSFVLSWSAPPPRDQNGMIRHYRVRCMHEEDTYEVLTDSSTERLIANLHPFYNYTCSVAAETIAQGPHSSTVLVTTLEDAPVAAPLSLSADSELPTSLSLQWLPPPEDGRNGIIITYSVNVTRVSTGDTMEFTDIEEPYLTVQSLRPYTEYSCSVAAHTVIGMGPYSVSILAITDEDAPSTPPGNLRAIDVTSTSIHLSWNPPQPDRQNGVIRHYSVIIFAEGSYFKTEKVSGTTLLLQDLHPFYSYHFTVCAVTVALGPCSTFDAITSSDVPSGSPVMISIVAINASSLRLSWEEPQAEEQNGVITSYVINTTALEIGEQSSFTTAGTSIELYNLHPFYTYSVTMAAATVNGTGPYSAVFTIQLPPDAPTLPPRNIFIETLSPTVVFVSWLPPAAEGQNGIITSYVLHIVEVGTSQLDVYERNSSHSEILIEGLLPSTKYECLLAAENEAGLGPFSEPLEVTTPSDAPTAPPQSIRVMAINSTALEVTWLPPPENMLHGAIRYYIVNGTEAVTMNNISQEVYTTRAVFGELHPHYMYSFIVAAIANDPGPFSEEVGNRTAEDVPSGPPRSITVSAVSSTSIQISWLPPREEDQNGVLIGYKLNLNSSSDPTFQLTLPQVQNLTRLISDLKQYHEYSVAVSALTDAGPGPFSSRQSVTTLEDAPSAPPKNVEVQAINSTSIEVSWQPPLDDDQNGIINGYLLWVNSSTGSNISRLIKAKELTAVISGLRKYYEYNVSVSASTEVGQGPFSPHKIIRTLEDVPDMPRELSAEVINGSLVVVKWKPPLNNNGILRGYQVTYERKEISALKDGPFVVNVSNSSTMAVVDKLDAGVTYTFFVRGWTLTGFGGQSDTVEATIPEPLVVGTASPFTGEAGAAAGGVLALIVLVIAGVVGVLGAMHLYKHKEKIPLFRPRRQRPLTIGNSKELDGPSFPNPCFNDYESLTEFKVDEYSDGIAAEKQKAQEAEVEEAMTIFENTNAIDETKLDEDALENTREVQEQQKAQEAEEEEAVTTFENTNATDETKMDEDALENTREVTEQENETDSLSIEKPTLESFEANSDQQTADTVDSEVVVMEENDDRTSLMSTEKIDLSEVKDDSD